MQLTEKITLPAGTYLLSYVLPYTSASATVRVYDGSSGWNETILVGSGSAGRSAVLTLSAEKTIWLESYTTTSVTYSNLDRGKLWAVRVA